MIGLPPPADFIPAASSVVLQSRCWKSWRSQGQVPGVGTSSLGTSKMMAKKGPTGHLVFSCAQIYLLSKLFERNHAPGDGRRGPKRDPQGKTLIKKAGTKLASAGISRSSED